MSKAVKLLLWKNDYIRTDRGVKLDLTSKQIIESVSNVLGMGQPADIYKIVFLRGMELKSNMNDEDFVKLLEKEKMISIEEYVPPVEPKRPKSDVKNISSKLREFWTNKDRQVHEDKEEPKPTSKQTKQSKLSF